MQPPKEVIELIKIKFSLFLRKAKNFLGRNVFSIGSLFVAAAVTFILLSVFKPDLQYDWEYYAYTNNLVSNEKGRAEKTVDNTNLITLSSGNLEQLGESAEVEGEINTTTATPKPRLGKLPVVKASKPLETSRAAVQLIASCRDCKFFPVSKTAALPSSYVPQNLVDTNLAGGGKLTTETAEAMRNLFTAAKGNGIDLKINSAYRSYTTQTTTFNYWYQKELKKGLSADQAFKNANRYSAQPGSSEHQLGTTADVACASAGSFDLTSQCNKAAWEFIKSNAHKYGFVISYPEGSEPFTGYIYEPWHIRYIGNDHAQALYDSGYLKGNKFFLEQYLLKVKLY